MKAGPKTIDAYLELLDDRQRSALRKLRTAILTAMPGAEECIRYGIPGFRLDGRVLVHIGAATTRAVSHS